MSNLKRLTVGAAVLAIAASLSIAGPAQAATATAFTLSASSLTPGSTVTATATFTATATSDNVGFALPPSLVGAASWTSISSVPSRPCLTEVPAGEASCLFNGATVGDTITVTATLSVPVGTALGAYTISTASAITPTELTQVLTVVDSPPVLDPIGPQTVAEGATLDVPITGADPDGDAVSFLGVSLPSFATLTDNGDGTATLHLAPGFSDAGSYSTTVAAFNGGGNDPETFTVTVVNTDRPPVLGAVGAQTVAEGATLDVPITGSDPDGDAVSFLGVSLPSFATLVDNGDGTATLHLAPGFSDAGSYQATVAAFNAGGNDPETFTITVTVTNRPPVLAPVGNRTVAEGATLVIPVSATDPDGDPLQFLPSGVPPFASFTDNGDGTGTLTVSPSFTDAGTYPITMLVTDGFVDDTEVFTLTVVNTNRAPVLTNVAPQVVTEGATSSVTVSATDPDGDPIILVAADLPGWASFVDNGDGTATITFAAGVGDVGDVAQIVVTAEDPTGAASTTTVEASVVDATDPTIFPPADITTTATSAAGAVVTYTVSAQDAVDGALSPDCVPPSGSTFPVGTTTVSCTVTDLDGNQASSSFQVTVLEESSSGTGGPGPINGGDGALAATGGSPAWGLLPAALAAILAGAIALTTRRRHT